MINKNCQNNRLNNYGITERDSEKKLLKYRQYLPTLTQNYVWKKVHKSLLATQAELTSRYIRDCLG
jgi:hypothetical protein